MSSAPCDPQSLRNVAHQLVRDLDNEGILWPADLQDYVTSIVRQWLTYEAHATLFTREGQLYLTVAPGRPGQLDVGRRQANTHWADSLVEDWKVPREDLLDTFRQLNLAQSAEVVNADGQRLWLSVNPRTSVSEVKPVDSPSPPPIGEPDFRIFARKALHRHNQLWLEQSEEEELASSVARQWHEQEGHAVLFLPDERLVFTIKSQGDGWEVGTQTDRVDLVPWLGDLGWALAAIPDVLRQLNAGQEIHFTDRHGVPCLLRTDSKAGTIIARRREVTGFEAPLSARPIFCPSCGAVLSPWREGEEQKTCPGCGLTIQ
jgi:hypothetical protein